MKRGFLFGRTIFYGKKENNHEGIEYEKNKPPPLVVHNIYADS